MTRKFICFGILPLAMLLAFPSCQKSYTCNCTYKDAQGDQKITYKIDPTNRQDAVTDCDNKAYLLKDNTSVSCSIE